MVTILWSTPQNNVWLAQQNFPNRSCAIADTGQKSHLILSIFKKPLDAQV
jgi:hypothetical protein